MTTPIPFDRFRQNLNEAISASNFDKARKLITSFIQKKSKSRIFAYPVAETANVGGTKITGYRYFIDGGKSARLNWSSKDQSNFIVSIDYWDGSKTPQISPSHRISFTQMHSLVAILPFFADLINGNIDLAGHGIYIPESETDADTFINPSSFLLEASSLDYDDAKKTMIMMISDLTSGISIKAQYESGGNKKYGPLWDRLNRTLQKNHPDLFFKDRSIGTGPLIKKDDVKKLDPALALKEVLGGADSPALEFMVHAGKAEEQESISDEDIERITYKQQLDSLKTGMKLLMSDATNSLWLGGRGGCAAFDTLMNISCPADVAEKLKAEGANAFNKEGGKSITTAIGNIYELVKSMQPDRKLIPCQLYDIKPLGLEIETKSGYKPVRNFVMKHGKLTTVKFQNGAEVKCSNTHFFMTPTGEQVFAGEVVPGDLIDSINGPVAVASVEIGGEDEFYDIEVDSAEHTYLTANGINHHNTGKTETVERMLAAAGKRDGDGYTKITGSASTSGIYRILFQNRNNIVLFDDSDGALDSQDSRNLFKAASDTKPKRKISWQKSGGGYVDPEDYDYESEEDSDKLPRSFEFTGKIIFISNLPMKKLDPDGALATRGYLFSVDPTNEEIFEFIKEIAEYIPLTVNYTLSLEDRLEVAEVLSKRKMPEKTANIRMFVRALNTRAGVEMQGGSRDEWVAFVKRFC